jgi:hypothetical protein
MGEGGLLGEGGEEGERETEYSIVSEFFLLYHNVSTNISALYFTILFVLQSFPARVTFACLLSFSSSPKGE